MAAGADDSDTRAPVTKERVLRSAAALADRSGIGSLTMRRLGRELGVEAMSLYKHVANKDAILDGLVELVVAEIEVPGPASDWKTAMRRRAISARRVLGSHPWAIGLLESRGSAGPAVLRYLDAIIASLRAGGFSVEMAGHAFWLLDSYIYGHVIQETSLPFDTSEQIAESTGAILEQIPVDEYPHLVEMAAGAMTPGFHYETEFEFGLDLILDALDRVRTGD
jgi:AcrR family transcriptional regulator